MRLMEICELIVDCPHSTAPDEGKGYPLIRTPNIGKGRLLLDNVHKVSEEVYIERNKRATPRENDLILAREAPVGNIAIIKKGQNVCLGQRTVLIRPNKEKVNPNYLVYYLLSPRMQTRLLRASNGATVNHLNMVDIKKLEIELPDIKIQNKVGKLLTLVDDKVEKNRKINKNLLEQIRTLCTAWLSDYEPFDGAIPFDWVETPLSDIAEFISGYSYKGTELTDSTIAMATIKNFDRKGGFKLDGYKEIIPSSKLKESQHAELFDILVAHTDLTQNAEVIGNAEPVMSKSGYDDIVFSMDLVKVLPKKESVSKFLIAAILQDKKFKTHCLGYVNGTTVLHLSKKALPEYKLFLPSDLSKLKPLDEVVTALYKQISSNISENIYLEKLRGALLPKLMSGELDVSVIDI